jgi:hypothetical protein
MDETTGPEDPNFMTVFAKCYSFAGRPRYELKAQSDNAATNTIIPGSNISCMASEILTI